MQRDLIPVRHIQTHHRLWAPIGADRDRPETGQILQEGRNQEGRNHREVRPIHAGTAQVPRSIDRIAQGVGQVRTGMDLIAQVAHQVHEVESRPQLHLRLHHLRDRANRRNHSMPASKSGFES